MPAPLVARTDRTALRVELWFASIPPHRLHLDPRRVAWSDALPANRPERDSLKLVELLRSAMWCIVHAARTNAWNKKGI